LREAARSGNPALFATDLPLAFRVKPACNIALQKYFGYLREKRLISASVCLYEGPELRRFFMTLHHIPFTPLSKQAVADLLDISIRSVENWINEGILPAPAKLGNRVFWHPDAFYGWLSKRLLEPAAEAQSPDAPAVAIKTCSKQSYSVAGSLRASTERKLARLEGGE